VSNLSIDPQNGGAFQIAYGSVPAFGISGVLAAVDDNASTLKLYVLGSSFTNTNTSPGSRLTNFFSYFFGSD